MTEREQRGKIKGRKFHKQTGWKALKLHLWKCSPLSSSPPKLHTTGNKINLYWGGGVIMIEMHNIYPWILCRSQVFTRILSHEKAYERNKSLSFTSPYKCVSLWVNDEMHYGTPFNPFFWNRVAEGKKQNLGGKGKKGKKRDRDIHCVFRWFLSSAS